MYSTSSVAESEVKVLDAGVVPNDEDHPFGRVLDGFLKLEGLI